MEIINFIMITKHKFNLKLLIVAGNIALLVSVYCPAFSQNIFDYSHSLSYADYLYKSRQFTLAAEEYERALFLSPNNDSIAAQLIKSYNLSGQCKQAKLRVRQLSLIDDSMPGIIAKEYARTLFCTNLYADVRQLLSKNKRIDPISVAEFHLYLELKTKNWKKADSILNNNKDEQISVVLSKYKDVVYKANHLKHRSPGIALLMSTVVPGSGKIYAGSWKDGLIAMVFIGGSAFQAYRGFSQKGVESVYGWIFGGVSTGFYLGNLYGSFKAAKKYNERKVHEVLHEAEKIWSQ
jgi:tetratricopeptide (TPR) repeat protein